MGKTQYNANWILYNFLLIKKNMLIGVIAKNTGPELPSPISTGIFPKYPSSTWYISILYYTFLVPIKMCQIINPWSLHDPYATKFYKIHRLSCMEYTYLYPELSFVSATLQLSQVQESTLVTWLKLTNYRPSVNYLFCFVLLYYHCIYEWNVSKL